MGATLGGALVSMDYLSGAWLPALDAEAQSALTRRTAALGRVLQAADRRLGPASGARAVVESLCLPMAAALGFEAGEVLAAGEAFHVTLASDSRARAVMFALPWGRPLDGAWRRAVRCGLAREARWVLVTNGRSLRLHDAAAPWTRRHLDVDLSRARLDAELARACAALLDAGTLAPVGATGRCRLDQLVADGDAHGLAVCRTLRTGVVQAIAHLLGGLGTRRGRRAPEACFEQGLVVVYRLLFLLFAESRGLVPVWHRLYRDGYSVESLAERAWQRPDAPGLWAGVRAISRMAHAGCVAGDLRVTAFNGRLFAPSRAPLAERACIPDGAAGNAIAALTTAPGGREGRRRIAYQDLGVEQLGAVYEQVLEHEPHRDDAVVRLTRTSGARKDSGSFYTPRALTEFLVRRTLAPLVDGRRADEILALRVVDPAMGSGAFLVAACRYLADAVTAAWRASEAAEADRADPRAEARRLVAQRCLYGVDRNPMAVQLARLSLWLTTLAADRPLSFLDHHLAAGDSLIGARLDDLARLAPGAKSPRARPLPLFDVETRETLGGVLPSRVRLALDADDSARAVREKERAFDRMSRPGHPLADWRRLADLWCAGWFVAPAPDARLFGDLRAAVLGAAPVLPAAVTAPFFTRAAAAAEAHGFLHWELTFPEVFFGPDGCRRPDAGFDAVLGNPPWDMLRADAGDAADREANRVSVARTLRFLRDTGDAGRHSTGHVNRYQLFVERALALLRPGGRLGFLVPSGLLLDHASAGLRRRLFDDTAVETIAGFDNRHAIFPIHRGVRFLALTATTGRATTEFRAAFGWRATTTLDALPDGASHDPSDAFPIRLSRALVERLDPEHLTVPDLAAPEDLALLLHLARVAPPLSRSDGWGVRFGRELNATDDRRHFRMRRPGAREQVAVLEGRQIAPFQADVARSSRAIPAAMAARLIDRERWRRPRVAYRDVAASTNTLTLIAALLPPDTLSTHTLFCQRTPLDEDDQWCLLAILNSFVANYFVRLHVTTHVTTAVMARLPAPRPRAGSAVHRALARAARRLAVTGIEQGRRDYVEVQARVAALYALTDAQMARVLDSFPLVDRTVREEVLRQGT